MATDGRPGIVVTGAAGRMGRRVLHAVMAADEVRLAGALVRPGHAWEGRDVGTALGGAAVGVLAGADALVAFAEADAVIDFSTPEASVGFAALAAQARLVHVIGTTGLAPAELARVAAAARHAVIVRAGNTSLGVAVLAALVRQAAAALPGWDVEIVEAHHGAKRDAPSGTALLLADAAIAGRGGGVVGTDAAGPRNPDRIGIASVRGGDIVGEHDVMLAGAGERVVLRHMATDRGVFADGALRAALWGIGRKPGAYGMADVLGL